ncbi:GNAT family N-acetyltransferase [Radiobacillus deserti]|uniref:GNAT family N-acetyltransferase n=1 Tax=Radiobacillus deserti TaxID=2594883 RepID=A0A516KCA6_9BACI|nr:GNAT family N-acetyltransferase [Radiobacillus deserti]QDP39029.1 GNAT family N-acetyltransferase [Radiobacillus deserti]
MSSVTIKSLITQDEWREAYPVMKHLRTHLEEKEFLELVEQAQEKDHYQLAALCSDGKMVAVIGYMPMITLYNGKFIWVCDLVTKPEVRSQGYGEQLLSYVEQWAKEHGYGKISLSSGIQRLDAHRFYEDKMDYRKVSYVFLKDL